jgi:hypothetical protein
MVILDGIFELLAIEERPVAAPSDEQIFVPPLLDDLTILEHDDPTRITNRADPMGRNERSASRQCRPKRVQNLRFSMRVDR